MAVVEANWEHHAFPTTGHLSKVDESCQNHQHHLHFPTATFHSLGQKMKTKATWCKKQSKVEMSPFCPETDIRETRLAYHIEVSLAGVGDKETLVIQWMSPRTLVVRGNVGRPDIGHSKPANGDRQWEGDTDGWAVEAKNPPRVSTHS
jgi:hypothetical protein